MATAPGPTLPPGRRLAIAVIRGYQLLLSPFLGPSCRYLPTCAEYTATAIARFGFWRGGWLGIRRIARCHPWAAGGFDPVPGAGDAPSRDGDTPVL